ncbi:MAG: DUF177 domain-containing protein [Acetobacteraceae bacterium]
MSAPELSRPVAADRLRAEGETVVVEATAAERDAVRARLGLAGLDALSASVALRPDGRGVVSAEGVLRARVTQVCVVSLEPFATVVETPFRLVFRPAGPGEGAADQTLDPEAEDEVTYEGTAFDLGEAMVETLALALDPWPRRPGAVLEIPASAAAAGPSPFAALARRRPG